MSRVGKQPIIVPDKVEVKIDNNNLVVKGPLGELRNKFLANVAITLEDKTIFVNVADKAAKNATAFWGLTRSLVNNMVQGVSQGFSKTLEVNGVGYRAAVKGEFLTLFLGFSHDINFHIPSDITIKCPKPTIIEVSGCDKARVGHIASKIRSFRPPEPYKGKGIKYSDEVIFRKEGKKK